MNKAYLLIGGNKGDRKAFLSAAREGINARCGVITNQSSIYETAAWGVEDQQAFFNQALEVRTDLTADELLQTILSIEGAIGRKRELKYGPRIIDVDILFFNDEVIKKEGLTVPHPYIQDRRFVLAPLCEIAPEKMHPVLHKTMAKLLAKCPDPLAVQKI